MQYLFDSTIYHSAVGLESSSSVDVLIVIVNYSLEFKDAFHMYVETTVKV